MPDTTPGGRRTLVTLLVPAYNEADNAGPLVDFFHEIRVAYPDTDFELVLVDDGSEDGTARVVLDALAPGDVARVASLSRNFGSHAGISAGLQLARGDVAITLSADLQEPIDLIGRFLEEWRGGSDIVWGIRSVRAVKRGPANLMSRAFSRIFHRYSDIPTYPPEGPSQILVARPAIDAVNAMPERNRNVLGMVAWVGFRQSTIAFEQLPRPAGKSKWTGRKKMKLVMDSFVEFSSAPMRGALYLGILLGALGLLALLATGVVALATWSTPSGLAALAGLVLVLSGGQLALLGLMGEYLWRTADEARERPVYVVRSVTDVGEPHRAGT